MEEIKNTIDYNKYNIVGEKIEHKKFGKGKIVSQKESIIIVNFDNGNTLKLQIPLVFTNHIVTCSNNDVMEKQKELENEIKSLQKSNYTLEKKDTQQHKYSSNEITMLTVLAGVSKSDCINYNIYCCKADKNFSKDVDYLGLYNDKSVTAIGKVKKIVKAKFINNECKASLYYGTESVTIEDIKRIENLRERGFTLFNCDIGYMEHYYFILEKFVITDYQKTSKNPLQGKKYFNLCKILEKDELPNIEEIAKELTFKKW